MTAVALLVLTALLVRRASQPPEPVPASAAAIEFSAERALAHVREIAQRPHPAGTPDNARVRDYVLAQLRTLGLEPEVQAATGVGTRYPQAGRVQNVVARLPGRTPGGLAVVLMAHYDGVPGGPAAGDDAAGTAAILETLRALRAGPPLAHDVIALITDGEEAGLLGAAAFVREHPWAKDVGVTLNFEARGTTGRSYMFETGPGNLDVARALATANDVSATSLSVTVYRSLPNDTDLSEIAVLGKPALNFAFADGVERYHTAHDDVAHLNPGSLQHHGAQMLALARTFGNGPLPRPTTGDAVFFDLPFVGLVVYPESWAWPIAIAAVVFVVLLVVFRQADRWNRDVIIGVLGTLVSTALGVGVAMVGGNLIARVHNAMDWGGAPAFRGIYTAALVMLAIAVSLAGWAAVRRWASEHGAHIGALVVWALLTLLVTWKLPGVSFMFVWPLVVGAIAASTAGRKLTAAPEQMTPRVRAEVWRWIATAVALAIIAPIVYAVSAVLLGAVGPGGIAAGALVPLTAWLLAPQLEALGGHRWMAAGVAALCGLALMAFGMITVRSSPDHPTGSQVVYAVDADSSDGWLAVGGPTARELAHSPDSVSRAPSWLTRAFSGVRGLRYLRAPRATIEAPSATVIADSTTSGERHLTLRVRAAAGTGVIGMRANDTRVLRAAIDGRSIDTSRHRGGASTWRLDYTAPPDSGATLALWVPAGTPVSLELLARTSGVPSFPEVPIPSRRPDVVTIHSGDITVIRRRVVIP